MIVLTSCWQPCFSICLQAAWNLGTRSPGRGCYVILSGGRCAWVPSPLWLPQQGGALDIVQPNKGLPGGNPRPTHHKITLITILTAFSLDFARTLWAEGLWTCMAGGLLIVSPFAIMFYFPLKTSHGNSNSPCEHIHILLPFFKKGPGYLPLPFGAHVMDIFWVYDCPPGHSWKQSPGVPFTFV